MLSKLTRRDRIALTAGTAALGLFLIVQFGVLPLLDRAVGGSVEEKELTLRRTQHLVANSGAELARLGGAEERLRALEAGLLESPSPALANGEWQRLIGQVADSRGIELGSTEFLRVQGLDPDYALVVGRVTLHCRLDQLVDFVSALASAPRIMSVTRLRVAPIQGDAGKRMNIEMTVGAAMHAVPATKGTTPAATPQERPAVTE